MKFCHSSLSSGYRKVEYIFVNILYSTKFEVVDSGPFFGPSKNKINRFLDILHPSMGICLEYTDLDVKLW
jgi:hypothetical protein